MTAPDATDTIVEMFIVLQIQQNYAQLYSFSSERAHEDQSWFHGLLPREDINK